MTTATIAPRNFSEGANYPSPVAKIIGLGYYDGVTSGVLRTADGAVYAFEMLGEIRGVDDADDVRRFELKPLPTEAFETIVAAIALYHAPEWPCWIPMWKFPTSEAQIAVDAMVEQQLTRASAPEWIVETTNLARDVLSVRRFSGTTIADPGSW